MKAVEKVTKTIQKITKTEALLLALGVAFLLGLCLYLSAGRGGYTVTTERQDPELAELEDMS